MNRFSTFSKSVKTAVAVAAMVTVGAAQAAAITNGSFESTTLTAPGFVTTTNVTGWTTDGGFKDYTFLAFGAVNPNNLGVLSLVGVSASPDGGNFIAADGDALSVPTTPISQTVTGLTAGAYYTISFWQAASHQSGFTGVSTTDFWNVSFGGATQAAANMTNSFTGWQQQALTFQATGTSETLSFLAKGGPKGVPPFVLLDGVSIADASAPVPEPGALALVGLSLAGLIAVRRRQNKA